jgi:hypothetical protein
MLAGEYRTRYRESPYQDRTYPPPCLPPLPFARVCECVCEREHAPKCARLAGPLAPLRGALGAVAALLLTGTTTYNRI